MRGLKAATFRYSSSIDAFLSTKSAFCFSKACIRCWGVFDSDRKQTTDLELLTKVCAFLEFFLVFLHDVLGFL